MPHREEILQRTIDRLAQLQATTAALANALTPAEVASAIVEHGLRVVGAYAGAVAVRAADPTMLEILSVVGYSPDVVAPWWRIPLSTRSPLTEAVESGKIVWIESREDLVARYGPFRVADQSASWVAVPLILDGQALGAITLSFPQPRQRDDEDERMMNTLASLCGQAIERTRLFEVAQEALRARDTFISVAAHDLRTPLTALLGQAQLMQRRALRQSVPPQELRSIQTIVEQALRLNRMIGTLLDQSRLQDGRFSLDLAPLDLAELLERLVGETQSMQIQHSLSLRCSQPLTLLGDTVRLEQVFQNLINNAIKYSPAGGSVSVTATAEAGKAMVLVTDNGIGIPAEALPKLFDRFYRAPNASELTTGGMGLGLFVVKEIVALHGGSVEIASVVNQGTTVTVRLPLQL